MTLRAYLKSYGVENTYKPTTDYLVEDNEIDLDGTPYHIQVGVDFDYYVLWQSLEDDCQKIIYNTADSLDMATYVFNLLNPSK